jgi:hypothetical protein
MRNMSSRALIPCLVAAIVTAAEVLTGSAALATAPSPGTVQVTGTQLKSALLPPSAFGHGGDFEVQNSGRTLEHATHPDLASIRCSLFSVLLGDSTLPGDPGFGFGATATATADAVSNGSRSYLQAVYQFANARTAGSLYAQTYAKYATCRSFVVSGERIRLNSESIIRLGGRPAFQVTQTIYTSGFDAPPPYETRTVFTVDGADAFILNSGTGRDASPASATPAALVLGLIARVQALR